MREFYPGFMKTIKKAEQVIEKVEMPVEESNVVCEKCGRTMVIRTGRYGKFLACPGYPSCRNAKPIFEDAGVKCPKCGGKAIILRTKRGRKYLGCGNYPKCDFLSWDMPSDKKCPKCGTFMTQKTKGGIITLKCANPECDHSEEHVKNKSEK